FLLAAQLLLYPKKLFCQCYRKLTQCSRASLYQKEEAENILLIIIFSHCMFLGPALVERLMQKGCWLAFITSKPDYSNSVFSNLPDEHILHPQMPLKNSVDI
ncbi:unnamed protein product, partial [Bubo scandiacus]